MEDKYYQMKDVMDKFMISRDMIKYYEKKGLIFPKRNDAGYRIYSEADIQRIKMILDIKDMGLDINDVEAQISPTGLEGVLKIVESRREEKEKEIVKLNEQMKKISCYEQWLINNKLYKDTFKVCYDFALCIGCKWIGSKQISSFYVRDLQIMYLSEKMKIETEDNRIAVLTKEAKSLHKTCDKCSGEKIVKFSKVYRGTWCYSDQGEIGAFLGNIYERAELLGYELCKKAYCLKRFSNRNGTHELLLDISIPFAEENGEI